MKNKKIMAAILAATLTFGMVAFSGCRDDDKDTAQTPMESVQAANDNMTMTEQGGNGIQMLSVLIKPSEYANYGVSESAESAHLVTASYPDDYVSNPAVDWVVEFVNASSEWAKGRKASDYVTVTPTSDGALTAVVACKQAFGEQIRVICSSRQMPELTDNFVCDYSTKILKVNTGFNDDATDAWEFNSVLNSVYYTDIAGTIKGEDCKNTINLNANAIVGKYAENDLTIAAVTTGTLLEWQEAAPWACWVETPNVSSFLTKLNASTILTKKDNVQTDEKGRTRSCGVIGLPYAEYLSESSLNKILYHWTKRSGGDVSSSSLSAYNDGGAAYNEYCRIMNQLTQTMSNQLSYTYSIDLGHTYRNADVEVDIQFVISNASEYFIVEPTGITLDTDHILFEP
ncbi:MAG: hypothetical protein E7357_01315 [Clostridiales bacterium]|nr:hypothetical protein [Clostridiales bacterium]